MQISKFNGGIPHLSFKIKFQETIDQLANEKDSFSAY